MEKALTRPLALDARIGSVLGITAFTLLTALGAFVRIPLPFTPVPVTLQVFFVLLAAAMLGRKAAISQALYVALGAAGLPVFTGAGAGFAHLMGPTGGYLVGFIVASFVIGAVMQKARSTLSASLALLLGVAIIYFCGTLQLGLLLHLAPSRALQLGALPFLAGDLLKAAAVLALVRAVKRQNTE